MMMPIKRPKKLFGRDYIGSLQIKSQEQKRKNPSEKSEGKGLKKVLWRRKIFVEDVLAIREKSDGIIAVIAEID